MAETSRIEWTDATWNIVTGCSLVSPACTNYYAIHLAGTRLKHLPSRAGLTREVNGKPVWTGEVRINWEWIEQPLQWTRARKIFVAAHGDLFHDGLAASEIATIFGVMVAAHHLHGHVLQVLTKRTRRMRELLSSPEFWEQVNAEAEAHVMERVDPLARRSDDARATLDDYGPDNPPPGIWLGATAERQPEWDERMEHLRRTPASFRFVSIEPMIGDISMRLCETMILAGESGPMHIAPLPTWLDLVIAGGEGGPGARSTPIALFRSLRDQCALAGVAFDFKQWGEWIDADEFLRLVAPERVAAAPLTFAGALQLGVDSLAACEHHSDGSSSLRVGKRRAGRTLDGREHNGAREVGS
jgi:protein gp37